MNLHETFHTITLKRKSYFNELLNDIELNLLELEILAYLNDYPDNNTFTEIQKWKDYSKSHVSTSITHLIDKGYISKEVSKNNKKIYHITLLEKSLSIIEEYKKCIDNFKNDAFKDISTQEREYLYQILLKISNNL